MLLHKDGSPLSREDISKLQMFATSIGYSSISKLDIIDDSNIFMGISVRQLRIFRDMSNGVLDKDICLDLCMSPTTLKRQIKQIFNKLGVSTRVHAISQLFRLGLIE